MIWSSFREKVFAAIEQQGARWTDDAVKLDVEIGLGLSEIAAFTQMLRSDQILFNPVAGQRSYTFGSASSAFTLGGVQVGLIDIVNIWYRDNSDRLQPLMNFAGDPGLSTLDDIQSFFPNYLDSVTYPAGDPQAAYFTPPASLSLFPAPRTAPGVWQIEAVYYHPARVTDSSIVIFPVHMLEDCVLYCAHKLMIYNATGDSRQALLDYLSASSSSFMAMRQDYSARYSRSAQRGSNNYTNSTNLAGGGRIGH